MTSAWQGDKRDVESDEKCLSRGFSVAREIQGEIRADFEKMSVERTVDGEDEDPLKKSQIEPERQRPSLEHLLEVTAMGSRAGRPLTC